MAGTGPTLVVDANVTYGACAREGGFRLLAGHRLVAPALMWSEARSSLHQTMFRGEVEADDAERTRSRIEACPVERIDHDDLGPEAWRIADELGWAKTYDAEYLALARLLGCKLITLDGRLLRGAARLDLVISPAEL